MGKLCYPFFVLFSNSLYVVPKIQQKKMKRCSDSCVIRLNKKKSASILRNNFYSLLHRSAYNEVPVISTPRLLSFHEIKGTFFISSVIFEPPWIIPPKKTFDRIAADGPSGWFWFHNDRQLINKMYDKYHKILDEGGKKRKYDPAHVCCIDPSFLLPAKNYLVYQRSRLCQEAGARGCS